MEQEKPQPADVEPTPEEAVEAPVVSEEERRAALPPAAQRALAEADARRAKEQAEQRPLELGGRDGPDPARFGDWEKKGIAIDF